MNLWLRYTLHNDPTAFDTFNDSLQSSSQINYVQSCSPLSIHQSSDQGSLKIYPNPVESMLQLELEEKNKGGFLVIYNGVGQSVHQQVVNSSHTQINVSMFPDGTYFAVYHKDSIKYSGKFVKLGPKS